MTSSHRATMRADAVCAEPRLWSTQVLSGVEWSNPLWLISPNLLWFKRCQNGIVFGAKLTNIHSQISLGFVKWAETILNYICTLCVFLCINELVNCANFFTPPPLFKQSNMRCPGSDYMSKLSYQESLREQMAASNPNSAGLKTSGMECVRRKRWFLPSAVQRG